MAMHPKPVVVPTPSELLIFRQEDWRGSDHEAGDLAVLPAVAGCAPRLRQGAPPIRIWGVCSTNCGLSVGREWV
jgi:hypothetical protein